MPVRGAPFYKMSGSGNDFVFFDARDVRDGGASRFETPERIRAVCARGSGVGGDGVVFVVPSTVADVGIRYYNADGSRASLCGNATLCTVRLAAELGIGPGPPTLTIETDAGVVTGRLVRATPEFDMGPVTALTVAAPIATARGISWREERIGAAVAGVPHVVVLVDDVDRVQVTSRGHALRHDPSLGAAGANVNFVARDPRRPGVWQLRTYERGVEGETLACGTGAVATAALLAAWGLAAGPTTELMTRSGLPLVVTLRPDATEGAAAVPSLRGEGRFVFEGRLAE